jgi:hypothetical protein
MWTQTKRNYDRHVEWMENWKDIVEEEDLASKVGLVPLFLMTSINVRCHVEIFEHIFY